METARNVPFAIQVDNFVQIRITHTPTATNMATVRNPEAISDRFDAHGVTICRTQEY